MVNHSLDFIMITSLEMSSLKSETDMVTSYLHIFVHEKVYMTIEFAKLARVDIMLVYDLNALLILLWQIKCLFAKMLTISVMAAVNIKLVYNLNALLMLLR